MVWKFQYTIELRYDACLLNVEGMISQCLFRKLRLSGSHFKIVQQVEYCHVILLISLFKFVWFNILLRKCSVNCNKHANLFNNASFFFPFSIAFFYYYYLFIKEIKMRSGKILSFVWACEMKIQLCTQYISYTSINSIYW